uniref:Phosphatase PP2A regulatory subunit A/Splicing factor 3B subunit 1-like HEAT repeat domain-containing protein n=1 Tax=Kalanchoe fedtschenkoi TaxID=63787 RepID=A0A7N0TZN7_KALFE
MVSTDRLGGSIQLEFFLFSALNPPEFTVLQLNLNFFFVGFQGADPKRTELDRPPPLPPDLQHSDGFDIVLCENNDDDDEVLLAITEELGVFIPYVGGVEHAHVLLPPLETLCTVEETCARDKAMESLCRIGAQMRDSELVEWFISLVKRLAAGEWFTARVSACGMFHVAYPSAPDLLKTELMSIYDLTQDDQDSVSLLAVEGCSAWGKLLEPHDGVSHNLPVIVSFSQDKSWRVRFTVANQLYELCEAVGPGSTKTDLVPAFVHLLSANEAEVRIAAAGKVTKFCRVVDPEIAVQNILPCVKELSSDSSQHVHSALASVIMGMAPVLGKG